MNEPLTFTFLGTGTSGGVPSLGCSCAVCRSHDPHDHRLRSAALLEHGDTRILIDCGPDIRQQLMPFDFRPLTAVLLTHVHYDHVGGLDDLRPFSALQSVKVCAAPDVAKSIRKNLFYCFSEHPYPGSPHLTMHEIIDAEPFDIGNLHVVPLKVWHGHLPIMGFRIGNLAYITDMSAIDSEEREKLKGVKTLVVNALRHLPHPTHQNLDEAIAFAQGTAAQQTYFIHMSHGAGLQKESEVSLPENMHFAYDGLEIEV